MKNTKLLSFVFISSILFLSAYLRLFRISEYMTFLGDEGRDALVVKRMIVDGVFTLLGPTASVGGFFLGPLYYYFMLPFLWLWRLDPSGPAVMVAIFGIASTYLVYRIGRDLFEPLVGYVAASLYAVSPLVIAHSRSSWNPNLVPFFSLILIYLIWLSARRISKAYLIGIGIVIGIGLQMHYLFLFLVSFVVFWFGITYKMRALRHSIYITLGFLLSYSPFILFELRHGFLNTRAILRFLSEGSDTGFTSYTFIQNITDVTFRSFSRLILRYPDSNFMKIYPDWIQILWTAAVFALIAAAFWVTVRLFLRIASQVKPSQVTGTRGYSKNLLLLVCWFVIPVVLFGFYRRAIYDYYLGIIFPIPFFFVGLVISRLYRSGWGALLASILWLALLYFNWEGRPYKFEPNNQLGQTKKIAQEALTQTGGKPFNFALITGSNSDHAYRYFFEIWGNKPVVIENFTLDPERKTVTDQLIVICELVDCQPLGHSLWEVAGFGRAEILGESNVTFVKIYKLGHYKNQ